ncbi:hypothetical protein ACFXGI_03130 [Streptomyces sp. NPDC059355]|uniref:hypothetical protein n=1 Tax=Streptomyces sp. NPDC059355 TaxID=3346811 RepID=UPI00368A5E5E
MPQLSIKLGARESRMAKTLARQEPEYEGDAGLGTLTGPGRQENFRAEDPYTGVDDQAGVTDLVGGHVPAQPYVQPRETRAWSDQDRRRMER